MANKIRPNEELTLEPGNSSVDYEKLLDCHKKEVFVLVVKV